MKKLFTSILLIAATLFVSPVSRADSVSVPLTANTVSNLFTYPVGVGTVTIYATTTNATTVNFYDNAALATTYVQSAYTYYTNYATNWTDVWTNTEGLVITNTFVGTYTAPVAVTATTNSLPKVISILIPGLGQRVKIVSIQTLRGLNAAATYGAIVEVDTKY